MESEQATEELVQTNSTWETVQMSDTEQSTENGELTDEQVAEQLRQAAIAAVADQISAVNQLRADHRAVLADRAQLAASEARYSASHKAALATGMLASDLTKQYNCPPPAKTTSTPKKTAAPAKKKPAANRDESLMDTARKNTGVGSSETHTDTGLGSLIPDGNNGGN